MTVFDKIIVSWPHKPWRSKYLISDKSCTSSFIQTYLHPASKNRASLCMLILLRVETSGILLLVHLSYPLFGKFYCRETLHGSPSDRPRGPKLNSSGEAWWKIIVSGRYLLSPGFMLLMLEPGFPRPSPAYPGHISASQVCCCSVDLVACLFDPLVFLTYYLHLQLSLLMPHKQYTWPTKIFLLQVLNPQSQLLRNLKDLQMPTTFCQINSSKWNCHSALAPYSWKSAIISCYFMLIWYMGKSPIIFPKTWSITWH